MQNAYIITYFKNDKETNNIVFFSDHDAIFIMYISKNENAVVKMRYAIVYEFYEFLINKTKKNFAYSDENAALTCSKDQDTIVFSFRKYENITKLRIFNIYKDDIENIKKFVENWMQKAVEEEDYI